MAGCDHLPTPLDRVARPLGIFYACGVWISGMIGGYDWRWSGSGLDIDEDEI